MPGIDLTELATRESEQVEWKENVADIDDVVEALCAFANDLPNLGGGYVVCGAREVKDEHGFPKMVQVGLTADRLKEVEGQVITRCRERVAPPLTPLVEEHPADTPDRRVLVFTQPATSSAHTFRRGREGAKHFVRVSRATIEARNGILLNLLVRKGATERWDMRACVLATERDLDLLVLRDTLNQMNVALPESRIEQFLTEDASLSPFVPSLCVREPLTNVLRPRNFAILLFGRNVQRFVPGAFSLFSVYPGTDRSDRHAERHELAGSVIEQARRLQPLLNSQTYTAFDKADPKTPNASKYPLSALYEAMGNALAHRDYELPDPVRITVFADRIEFLSPGSLPLGIDATLFARGEAPPKWRNLALAWFFNRLQLAQAEGQGIPTILRSMRDEGCPPPIFRPSSDAVICILPAHPRHVVQHAVGEVQKAIARGDIQRACDYIEVIAEKLDLAERRAVVDPTRLLDLAQAMGDQADNIQTSRRLVARLVASAGKMRLTEDEFRRAADLLFRYGDVAGLVALVDDQFVTNPTWAWRPRLLAIAGSLLLRAAVQAANSIEASQTPQNERLLPMHEFDTAAEEATKLFINAQRTTEDPEIAATAKRALAVIRHLARQRATRDVAPADRSGP